MPPRGAIAERDAKASEGEQHHRPSRWLGNGGDAHCRSRDQALALRDLRRALPTSAERTQPLVTRLPIPTGSHSERHIVRQ
jgi:hypothetical protein